MNYKNIYDSIILKATNESEQRNTEKNFGFYFEKHHIIPRSLGGSDEEQNLTLLTAREHFLCHWLLAKHYKKFGTKKESGKMIAAFTQMCRGYRLSEKDKKTKINSHSYSYARKMWSDWLKLNHWAHSEEWKKNQSLIMKKYYKENPPQKVYIEKEDRACGCGCGNTFNVRVDSTKKYIHGHNPGTELSNLKKSKSLKKYLETLSKEELAERQKKSLGSCDHEKRGKKISDSKRGKKSTQKEIVGKRLAALSENEFLDYLNEKNYSQIIRSRFTTYRNFYLNNG